MVIRLRLFYLLFPLLMFSCSKDADKEAPVVTIVMVNGESENLTFEAGTQINIQGSFSDNEDLSQCRIEIHPASDGHSHIENDSIIYYPYSYGEWSFFSSELLEGMSDEFSLTTSVPDSVQGQFHLIVNAIDTNGNESEEYFESCEVSNENLPQINASVLNGVILNTEEVVISFESMLTIEGNVSDSDGIQELELAVFSSAGDTLSMETFFPSQNSIDLEGLMQSIIFDNTLANRFRISAIDILGWRNEYVVYIDVQ